MNLRMGVEDTDSYPPGCPGLMPRPWHAVSKGPTGHLVVVSFTGPSGRASNHFGQTDTYSASRVPFRTQASHPTGQQLRERVAGLHGPRRWGHALQREVHSGPVTTRPVGHAQPRMSGTTAASWAFPLQGEVANKTLQAWRPRPQRCVAPHAACYSPSACPTASCSGNDHDGGSHTPGKALGSEVSRERVQSTTSRDTCGYQMRGTGRWPFRLGETWRCPSWGQGRSTPSPAARPARHLVGVSTQLRWDQQRSPAPPGLGGACGAHFHEGSGQVFCSFFCWVFFRSWM